MLIRSTGSRDFRKFFFDGLRIQVNGADIADVIEADDEAGYVVRYLRTPKGELMVDGSGCRYETERLEGKVEFVGQRRRGPDDAKADAMDKRDRRALRNLRNQARSERGQSDAG